MSPSTNCAFLYILHHFSSFSPYYDANKGHRNLAVAFVLKNGLLKHNSPLNADSSASESVMP